MKSRMSLKFGHLGSKTRSLGQILEKPYAHCIRYVFSLILMKLGQNACLYEISDKLDIGPCGGLKLGLSQIFEEPIVCFRGHIFSPIPMELGKKVCLDKIKDEF